MPINDCTPRRSAPQSLPSPPPSRIVGAMVTTDSRRGGVILLHGMGRTGNSMRAIAAAMRRSGSSTLSPWYGLRRSMAKSGYSDLKEFQKVGLSVRA